MSESSLTQVWMTLIGSLAFIALILIAFGLMLGIVKPADGPRRVGAVLGIVIVLMLIPGVLASAWSDMSLWQQIAFVAIGIGVWQWRRPRRQPRDKRGHRTN